MACVRREPLHCPYEEPISEGETMKRIIRSFLLLPLLAILLVAVPAVLLSMAGDTPAAIGQTVPGGTVPPTIKPTPTRVQEPGTPGGTVPAVDLRVRANGLLLEKVIGHRLSDTIYAYTQNGRLLRTDDNAASWGLVTTRPEVSDFLMSAADPDVLYAGGPLDCHGGSGVNPQPFARSDDGGVSFVETAAEPAAEPVLRPLIIHPDEPLTLIAGGCGGLYESTDGGESWLVLSRAGVDGIPAGYVVQEIAAAYAANDPDAFSLDVLYAAAYEEGGSAIVLASSDEGRTWEVITPDMGNVRFSINALEADPVTAGRLWFAGLTGVWSTEDLGQFWGFSSRGLKTGITLTDIVLHPDNRLLLGSSEGLYGKGTAVSRWSALGDETFQELDIESLLLIDSYPGRLWINAADGVYAFEVK